MKHNILLYVRTYTALHKSYGFIIDDIRHIDDK